jgi:hypothetical protein
MEGVMGTITFEGQPPFALITQRLPTATSVNKTVVLTLPVFLPDAPANTVEIQVTLAVEHAEQLAAQIQPALKMAQVRNR